jgi:NTP pyrophosphatase (non-canonical NTP hydrolase)
MGSGGGSGDQDHRLVGKMIEPSCRFLHAIEKDGQTPETRLLILMHELGEIANRISKARRIPDDSNLYMADIKIDIGQSILQLEMLALDLGLVPSDCYESGLETTWQHFKEWWHKEDK